MRFRAFLKGISEMDFIERLQGLSKKITKSGHYLETEEATKNALIMPFLHSVLGYDVFDPTEVVPEFTADAGIKKGEKSITLCLKMVKSKFLLNVKSLEKNYQHNTPVSYFAISLSLKLE